VKLYGKDKKEMFLSVIGIVSALLISFGLIQYRERALGNGNINLVMSRETRLNSLSEKASIYYYNEEYDNAIKVYNDLHEKDNENPLWFAKIAEIYSVKDEIEKSEEYIAKAKELKNINENTLNYIIFTEYMNGKYEDALVDGEEALNKYPDDKKLREIMYAVYMNNNKVDKAYELIKSYPVDLNSSYDTATYARMLLLIGEKSKGYNMLRRAWDIDKDEYKIYDVLAQIAVYNQDSLLKDITELSKKNSSDDAYKVWLAKIYSKAKGTSDMAIKLLNEVKNDDVGDIEIKLIEAYALQNVGQNDKADNIIDSIISSNKEDFRVYHTASWYYLGKNDFEKALIYCKKSIKANPNYPDNYGFLMPAILDSIRNYEKNKTAKLNESDKFNKIDKVDEFNKTGRPYLRTALMLEPYNYNIMLNIANHWYEEHNLYKALKYFTLAESVKPDDPEIKYSMASIHIQKRVQYLGDNADKKLVHEEEEKAIELLKECNKLSENDPVPKYHRTLGTLYMLQGKSKEAIEQIRLAYHADESDVLNLNNAGCYYITMGNNLERGYYNLLKAYEGLNDSLDQYVIDIITENYQKANKLIHEYYNGKDNEIIHIPDFQLFY